METIKEAVPFLVGIMVPPFLMLIMNPAWSKMGKFVATILPAIIIGGTISVLVGEVIGIDPPEAIVAIIIDSSLVYTGSQVAYHLAWKGLLKERLANWRTARAPRIVQ
ncbi:MAG TPA: hypothetical protein VFU69_11490 [Ktedonobacterales bacterium]|nr:hypothetical protein [Ktedonobacterales bacterium]